MKLPQNRGDMRYKGVAMSATSASPTGALLGYVD
jgi:hypothetical protein